MGHRNVVRNNKNPNLIKRAENVVGRVRGDFLRGEFEKYIAAILALAISVLGFIDGVSLETLVSAALMALAYILFNFNISREIMVDLDQILLDRSEFTQTMAQRIESDNITKVWLMGPSLVNVLAGETLAVFRDKILSQRDGEIRVIIQDPDHEAGYQISVDMLDGSKIDPENTMDEALPRVMKTFDRMNAWDKRGKFEYGYLAFTPGFSLIILNPEQQNSVVILELHGFLNGSDRDRMHIEIKPQESDYWYQYWLKQYKAMWNSEKYFRPGNF